MLGAASIAAYFYAPHTTIVSDIVLSVHFSARLLRLMVVYHHYRNRKAFIETTKDDIVDFAKYNDDEVMC